MSALIFPPYSPISGFPGQQLTKYRRPTQNTHTQRALSGKESRLSLRAYPLMEWELSFDWLPDNAPPNGQGRANYVSYSQDGSAWTFGVSGSPAFLAIGVPNYTTAPDDTLTATRIILNSPGAASSQYSNVAIPAGGYPPIGSNVTGSVWMKTNDGSTVSVNIQVAYVTSTLCRVTPQWQRFSVTGVSTVSAGAYFPSFYIYNQPSSGAAQYADISAWGAQVEIGGIATRYIYTSGAAVRQSDLKTMLGFFMGVLGQWDTFLYKDPDFNTMNLRAFATGNGATTDFNLTANFGAAADGPQFGGVTGLAASPEWVQNTLGAPQIYTARYGGPELLSSGSRTNLALQAKFAASWGAANGTLTANATPAPDGTTTAASFNEGTANGQHYVSQVQAGVLSANGRYTFSVWAKANQGRYMTMYLYDSVSNGVFATFDLVNGVISQSPTIVGTAYASAADAQISGPYPANDYSTNGFYRCSVSGQFASTTLGALVAASNVAQSGGSIASYTGAGLLNFFLWGAQVEAGTQPTALIPTTTAAASNGGSDYSLTNLSVAGSVYTFQQVQFASAPANNVSLLWSGSFFYRVRFSEDHIEPQQILSSVAAPGQGHWKLDGLKLEQVIL